MNRPPFRNTKENDAELPVDELVDFIGYNDTKCQYIDSGCSLGITEDNMFLLVRSTKLSMERAKQKRKRQNQKIGRAKKCFSDTCSFFSKHVRTFDADEYYKLSKMTGFIVGP